MYRYRNNIVAIHAALVVCAFAWLWGGMRGPELVPVMPWLVALLLECMLFFPERHGTEESSYQARERVWKALGKDPLVWVETLFLFLLIIPFGNNGLCPRCDAALIAEGMSADPYVGFLPYCVNRLNHLSVFMWFLPTMVALTAVKHALTKDGKRWFCELVVWNAAVLAVLGFVQQVLGAPGPLWWNPGNLMGSVYFFSTFGYPNAGGAYFATCFCIAMALWRRRDDDVVEAMRNGSESMKTVSKHSNFWMRHYMAIPTLLIFYAALNTLSRAAMILVTTAAVVFAAHAIICTLARLGRAQRVKAAAKMLLVLIGVAIFISNFAPKKFKDELSTITSSNEALDRVTGRNEHHSRIAMDLFWEHPLFGCGGWGYAHLSPSFMTEDELKSIDNAWQSGGANVHNDYLQFLAEHGAVGFGCMLLIAVMLLVGPCRAWRQLYMDAKFSPDKKKLPAKPLALFVLPAPAFCMFVGMLVVLIHAFGDCPLRSPAVLSLLFCEFAALDGFMPHVEIVKKEEPTEREQKHHRQHRHTHGGHSHREEHVGGGGTLSAR